MRFTKQLIQLVLIGCSIAVALIFWQRTNLAGENPVLVPVLHSSKRPSAAADSGSSETGQTVLGGGARETVGGTSFDLRELVHGKLRQYRARKTGDEATSAALDSELLALLTDANAGDIVLFLSEDELGTPFGQAALGRWLEVDFQDALKWAVARGSTEGGEILLVAKKILNHSDQILALCRDLPAGAWRQQLLGAAGLEAVAMNHPLALTLALQMEPDAAQTNVLQTAVYDWMGHDPVAASNWLLQAEGPLREQLSLVAAKAVANTDPEMAARWLMASSATEEARSGTMLTVVEIWSARDPVQTANWVSTFPAGRTRDAAVDLLVHEWQKAGAAATNAWIKQLPDSAAILARQTQAAAAQARVVDPE